MTEPWATLAEVAEHLQVAQETVHRWIRRKALPAHRLGRNWRFKLSEVDEWVRQGGASDPESPATPEET